ncbi:MAG TPA: CCA tRNA nucleotidyltransferase [Xanthobacteraceae bacterium]|nr:CCA tRNA nucleotidyltransferase [Xanthobacteraceae bacterium]
MTAAGEPVRIADTAWLTNGALGKLLAVLDRDGEEARVVGGAVRNVLIGEALGEVDVATTAPPPEVIRRAEAAGFKAVPTGIEHGTITVVVDHRPFEVTTLREDVETFGRHAVVRFGRDWRADAARRDFTINALSLSRDGIVHDYVGGLADIAVRRVRFIGQAAARIAEDYLRVLRFFRFHAAYGVGLPDPEGLQACVDARERLDKLSRERVRMELLKLLVAAHAVPTVAVMAESGLLAPVLGGVPYLASISNMMKVEAACGLAPDPVRRLGALAVMVVEDAERLWQRLRLTNAEHDRLASMADGWWRVTPAGESAARVLLYRLGPERFTDRVLLAWARSEASAADASWRAMATLPERWIAPAFPIRAADLMARGVPKGPRLGAALAQAEEAWIAQGFPGDMAAVAQIADAVARNVTSGSTA